MRWFSALLFLASVSFAHGGGGFRGPNGSVPPRVVQRIPCACAKPSCSKCKDTSFTRADGLAKCETKVTEVERWGDVARVRVTLTLRAHERTGMTEAYLPVEPAPVFALVKGSVGTLEATLRKSEDARQIYLFEKRRKRDPLLIVRRTPGRFDVRVFPVPHDEDLVIRLEGYALVGKTGCVYTTGDGHVEVKPDGKLHFFISRRLKRPSRRVDFVPALKAAWTGKGEAAATRNTALAAFEPGARKPPFVGPDRVGGPPVPPPPPPPA